MMKQKHVLVLTSTIDTHADAIVDELYRRDVPVLRFNQSDYPTSVSLSASYSGEGRSGVLRYQGCQVPLSQISAVWRRRPSPYTAPEHFSPGERNFIEEEARIGLLSTLDTHCFCVSRSSAIRAAENKPLQLMRAQELGLAIPQTLLTNEPEAVRTFYHQCHERMILKAVTSGTIRDDEQNIRSLFTHRVSQENLSSPAFQHVRATTHLFQELVPKAYDLRVVVIGRHVFPVEIHIPDGDNLDFRTRYPDACYRLHQLPDSLTQRLLTLVRSFGLQFSSMDMIVTPDGDYVWIELNPNGQFYWLQCQLEQQTGDFLPLKETMADLLMKPEEHCL